jgi:hypothetical protein
MDTCLSVVLVPPSEQNTIEINSSVIRFTMLSQKQKHKTADF